MALSEYALSSVDSLQAYASLAGCDVTAAQMESLINASSAWIERAAGRKFKARDYIQWYNGQWQEQLSLEQFPVLYVQRIAYGNSIALNISYSGNSVQTTVTTSETALTLRQITAAGVATTSTLLLATYPTWSTLATAINAVTGFTATVGTADGPSNELAPGIYADFGNSGGTVYVYYPTFDQPTRFVDRAAGIVGFAGSGWAPWGYSTPASGNNIVYPSGAFMPSGFQGIMIKYRAGYETIPADIEMLCNEVATYTYYQGKSNPSLKSENIGDYSYTRGDQSAMMMVFGERVRQFANMSIGGA